MNHQVMRTRETLRNSMNNKDTAGIRVIKRGKVGSAPVIKLIQRSDAVRKKGRVVVIGSALIVIIIQAMVATVENGVEIVNAIETELTDPRPRIAVEVITNLRAATTTTTSADLTRNHPNEADRRLQIVVVVDIDIRFRSLGFPLESYSYFI